MSDPQPSVPLVSVLTPILNEAEHLVESVAAMRTQTDCGEVEILLIDGGSTDGTQKIASLLARLDPRVRVLSNPKRRTPNALNIGLRAARGRFIARMDAHTLYPNDYLARGIDRLQKGDVAWVSGPQLARGRGAWSRRVALALSSRLGIGGAAFRTMPTGELEVDSGFTGVWMRDGLVELGGWDEGWPINQDGELAGRIRERGGRIVCLPEMAATYVPRDSLTALARQYWSYGQFKAKTCKRHPTSMRRSHLLPIALVTTAMAAPSSGAVGRAARAAMSLYAVIVAASTVRVTPREPLGERLGVASALVIIHCTWGAGFMAGCIRFGAPLKALGRLLTPGA
jgi:glycosyltransferase involved in cell wall biosynthesis